VYGVYVGVQGDRGGDRWLACVLACVSEMG